MAKITKKFTIEELEEKYDLPWGAVSNDEVEQHRWYTTRELVFAADDGFCYRVDYMDPASEMQEDQERWYITGSEDFIDAVRVVPKEVLTTIWVDVDA